MKFVDLRGFKSFNIDHIVYRGEGNSSIVVGLKDRGQVIKLLKKDLEEDTYSENPARFQDLLQIIPSENFKFIEHILRPLMEPYMNFGIQLVHLESGFVRSISKMIETHRPAHRLNKMLIFEDQYAMVMDDLCALPSELMRIIKPDHLIGPTISIELKPKQGFLPVNPFMLDNEIIYGEKFASRLGNNCLYGMMQHLKLAKGRINRVSNYCPIGLFSGCPAKMKHSIKQLIKNPQNNFRIFKDSSIIFHEGSKIPVRSVLKELFRCDDIEHEQDSDDERFIDLLIRCLLNDGEFGSNKGPSSSLTRNGDNQERNCDICQQHSRVVGCAICDNNVIDRVKSRKKNNHTLPESSVLGKILKIQKLDNIGVHEASYMLKWLQENETDTRGLVNLNIAQRPNGFSNRDKLSFESKGDFYFRKVWEFLISMIAKDCSILITLHRISFDCIKYIENYKPQYRKHLLVDEATKIPYLFSVNVTDLDQKKPHKIAKLRDNIDHIYNITNYK